MTEDKQKYLMGVYRYLSGVMSLRINEFVDTRHLEKDCFCFGLDKNCLVLHRLNDNR